MQKSMSLGYEPVSEPLHTFVKQLFLNVGMPVVRWCGLGEQDGELTAYQMCCGTSNPNSWQTRSSSQISTTVDTTGCVPHSAGESERERGRESAKERKTERQRDREPEKERKRERQRERERETEGKRERERPPSTTPQWAQPHPTMLVAFGAPLPSEEETTPRLRVVFPARQGQNLALTVICVPYSLDSGTRMTPNLRAVPFPSTNLRFFPCTKRA